MWGPDANSDTYLIDPLAKEIASIRKSRGISDEAALPDIVTESWKRCLADYNLLPDAVPRPEVLGHAQMRAVIEEREEFLRIAEPEVERLFSRLVDSEYLVSLASSQGAMLLFRCDYQYLGELAGSGVIPGSVWTEDRQGTNGVGTSLRVGKSVSIVGSEHYGVATQSLTCLTTPVFGRQGVIESVINVTTARSGDARMNQVVKSILERSARRIENSYFGRINRRNLMLRIIGNGDISDVADEGRLSLDENGLILDVSSHVARLLNQPIDSLVGASAEDLFDMDTALADLRPDAAITLSFRGKSFQAVLNHPEVRAARPSGLSKPVLLPDIALRTVDLAEEVLRINPILSQSMDRAQRLLSAGLPVVVTGESGVGKTAFAKAVARRCFGQGGEIVFIDCASLEPQADFGQLLQRRLKGQRACLLIDRIDELDDGRQAALLGLLESDRQASANGIGVIVISTVDLEVLVRDNRLRADLLHRLKGGAVTLAPLRNAPDLESTIVDLFATERDSLGRTQLELDDEARLVLMHYHWPGNLRELRNALRHAIALADGKLIRLEHLPDDIVEEFARKDLTARSQSEASKIEAALRYNSGNVSLTARYLGVSRATLYRKIQITKARGEA